ncbi:Nicotinate-nucleotide pyrophosphorylase [carboxylating] [bioreactor metagenome]|uniref:Probable nicotinate-nucleotide pyrophosphorylase [carboxylating] n=1 Tax=bioreactor metagenome TaxID=1076179 RepID=A0A644Y4T2_9ZZZZ|nr:carboxylating nicotinate-nucleotide diphosphorylase [Oscillospiraceae bacterium]
MLSVHDFIKEALSEDVGTGDITTLSTIPASAAASGKFIAKEDGIICGLEVCRDVFLYVDPAVLFEINYDDGVQVNKGDVIAVVSGNARSLLTAERTALNILQHMSGIATRTRAAVEAVKGTKAKIVDTRKTTPCMRVLEKYAVKCGGGSNHRFNLADGVLIKDNHIVASGSITAAVENARKNAPHTLKIEVEVENFEMLDEALRVGADIIMLDNMSVEDMKKAVIIVGGRSITEASGNMGDKDLYEVASTGVDLISIGALTHSVRAMDISLKFKVK